MDRESETVETPWCEILPMLAVGVWSAWEALYFLFTHFNH